jgi:parvulin-like peptidyl-prolyl isomerase
MKTPVRAALDPCAAIIQAALVLLMLVSCAGGSGDADVVARWNGGDITRADYESWLLHHEQPGSDAALRAMVLTLMLADSGDEDGAADDLATRYALEAARQRVLVAALQRHVMAKLSVSPAELEKLQSEHPEAFHRPRKLRLRNIFLKVEDASRAAGVRRRMQSIRARLLDGDDFEEMARRVSESQTRFRGGHLGFLSAEELGPEIADGVRDLQPGQLSEVIEHPGGMTLFLCEEVREATTLTPEEVRQKLEQTLRRVRGREVWRDYTSGLLAGAEVQLKPGDPNTVLVVGDYRLGADALPEMAAVRLPSRDVADLDDRELERLLRSWALAVLCADRAEALGLDAEAEVAAKLRWSRLEVLARRELTRRVEERFQEPGEDELRAHFRRHSQQYQEPAAYSLDVIQLAAPPDHESREVIRRAVEIEGRLDAGEIGFDEAARRYSVHASAANGGHLPWVAKGQIAAFGPTAARAIHSMAPGESSGLLRTSSGLWIIALRDVRGPRPLSFEDVRDRVARDLAHERIRQLESEVRGEALEGIDLVTETSS